MLFLLQKKLKQLDRMDQEGKLKNKFEDNNVKKYPEYLKKQPELCLL